MARNLERSASSEGREQDGDASVRKDSCAPEVRAGEKAPRCRDCPFAKGGVPHHRPVRPFLPRDPAVGVLLGEGPGRDEVQMGEPFVGMTGEEINRVLAENNLARSRLLIANAMACIPPVGERTEPNMRAASTACRRWVLSILRLHVPKPTPTLAMGKWAGFLATGKARAIGDARGFVRHESKRLDPLILTWHPTFALFRNPWEAGNFAVDMDRFARATGGELQRMPRVTHRPPSLARIQSLWNEPFFTVDIETGARHPAEGWTGKDPTQATVKVVGVGTPRWGRAMWWAETPEAIKREVRALLWSRKVLKVLQNGPWFDIRVLKRYGLPIRHYADTRDMRRAISTTSRLSLGYMASTYLDVPPWKEEADDGKE